MPANKTRFQTSKPGGASTLGSGSGSKKAHAAASGFPTKASHVQVLYNGKIVTPQSLLPKKTAKSNFMKKKMTATGPTEEETQEDILQEDVVSEKLPAPLTASSRKTTMGGRRATGGSEELASRGRSLYGNVAKKEVEETITMIISETPTEILLSLPSLIISTETRDAAAVEENNARYAAQIASHKNEDGFASHPTQTLNNPQKNQNEMAAPNASQDMSCQVHSYDISDTMADHSTSTDVDSSFVVQETATDNDGIDHLTPYVRQTVTDTVSLALSTPGTTLDVMETTKPPGAMVIGDRKDHGHKSLSRRQQSGVYNMSHPTLDHTVSGEFQQQKDESKPSESGAGTSDDHHLSGHGNTAEDEFPDFVQQDSLQILREKSTKAVMESDTILKKLQMVERAVQQNAYYGSILEYRDLPEIKPLSLLLVERAMVVDSVDNLFGGGVGTLGGLGRPGLSPHANPGLGLADASIASDTTSNRKASNLGGYDPSATSTTTGKVVEEEEEEKAPKVKKMFTYAAPSLVQGRTVTAMTWNTENKDVLAVGYGKVEFTVEGLVPTKSSQSNSLNDDERNSGLVLFWSLRNPDYPEKVLRTPFPVTSLDFSSRNPTLLAVGFYSGDIAVYDVRREEDWDKPVESSVAMSDSHSDPVWQVKWLAKGMDRTENLVSISTDGNVLQWSLKKGLVVSLLMQLKRGGAGEGWISRQAAGLCLDFAPSDPGTYVTGTEEGYIHKCSVSYNEQYLETYTSHNGPVYRIKFSPWWSDVFLSCSADWTVHLYHLHNRNSLLSFHSSGEDFSVTDVAWAPRNSTVFAAITSDAKLQIWDITYSDIDPVVSLDTNLDVDDTATTAAPSPTATSHYDTSLSSRKGTAIPHRRDAKPDKDENDRESSVSKLLKALASGQNRRMLTSVLFAETSPVVVVGDSTGVVTVYRVNEPIIMRDVSHPADLTERLQDAVWRQADPAEVTKIQNTATQVQNNAAE